MHQLSPPGIKRNMSRPKHIVLADNSFGKQLRFNQWNQNNGFSRRSSQPDPRLVSDLSPDFKFKPIKVIQLLNKLQGKQSRAWREKLRKENDSRFIQQLLAMDLDQLRNHEVSKNIKTPFYHKLNNVVDIIKMYQDFQSNSKIDSYKVKGESIKRKVITSNDAYNINKIVTNFYKENDNSGQTKRIQVKPYNLKEMMGYVQEKMRVKVKDKDFYPYVRPKVESKSPGSTNKRTQISPMGRRGSLATEPDRAT